MDRSKFPCRNCDDRYVGCHGSCDSYKKFKARIDTEREAKQKEQRDTYYSKPYSFIRARHYLRKA